jgi:hypothetical protein
MKKKIQITGRYILLVVLLMTFQLDNILNVCRGSCDGGCRVLQQAGFALNTGPTFGQNGCCSDNNGGVHPCCQLEKNPPGDSRYFLLNFDSPKHGDPVKMGLTSLLDYPKIHNQSRLGAKENLCVNSAHSIPIYIQNLTFLC